MLGVDFFLMKVLSQNASDHQEDHLFTRSNLQSKISIQLVTGIWSNCGEKPILWTGRQRMNSNTHSSPKIGNHTRCQKGTFKEKQQGITLNHSHSLQSVLLCIASQQLLWNQNLQRHSIYHGINTSYNLQPLVLSKTNLAMKKKHDFIGDTSSNVCFFPFIKK